MGHEIARMYYNIHSDACNIMHSDGKNPGGGGNDKVRDDMNRMNLLGAIAIGKKKRKTKR